MRLPTLKAAVKRGALIAAANWQVTLIQATADSLFKLLLASPIIGGVFLVALVLGGDPESLMSLEWREMAATIVSTLLSQPLVLTLFLLAVAVVAVGGSFFVFLIKAGTVATIVRSDRDAGAIEDPPLRVDMVARASRFSVDSYVEACQILFPRYARLGVILMAVYMASGIAYLTLVAYRVGGEGWAMTTLITASFIAWITIVNLLYLLVQIVIAADDCSVASAARRVGTFLRREIRTVGAIFLLVLALVVAATGASLLATAALSLVAFVPFVGLAALPLQLFAWLLRGVVFQYLGLTSVGAYLKVYRRMGSDPIHGSTQGVDTDRIWGLTPSA
jgi:hypothetical protein